LKEAELEEEKTEKEWGRERRRGKSGEERGRRTGDA
tara:strand:- start:1824 stop:1931 length:108 start_codon:yes stop_codon:yes gene_type:complete